MLDMFSDKLRLIRSVLDWIDNAKWWHFWNPGTGLKGGVVCALVLSIILHVIF